MNNTNMNRQLGTKWFTFYTKVRPWFTGIGALAILVDFFNYIDVYFNYWWMLLYLAMSIAQPVLAIIVAMKADDDYGDFVRFVKGVLLFEIIHVAYQQGVQQYIENEFELSSAIVTFMLILTLAYFAWYRLNVKYFEKRLLVESPELTNSEVNSPSRAPQISNPGEVPPSYDNNIYGHRNIYIYGSDCMIQADEIEECEVPNIDNSMSDERPKALFCRKCGNKLEEDALFCSKCGTKIIADNQ